MLNHVNDGIGNVTTDFIPDFEAELLPEPKQAPPEFVAIAAAVRHYANAAASLDNCEPARKRHIWACAMMYGSSDGLDRWVVTLADGQLF